MLRLVLISVVLQCCLAQQYQQKVAPGVPPSSYQNYQQPPPPPPPQQYQQQPPAQQQYQPPPPQQQQYQQQQQVPIQQQQVPVQQQQVPIQQQQVPQGHGGGHDHHGDPMILNTANIAHERDHIQEHMDVPIDTSKMSEQELQFHYFKMHDADNNNKLDGCELIKSLIHWHGPEEVKPVEQPTYSDKDLEQMVEGALRQTDKNNDGYIDYAEFKAVTSIK